MAGGPAIQGGIPERVGIYVDWARERMDSRLRGNDPVGGTLLQWWLGVGCPLIAGLPADLIRGSFVARAVLRVAHGSSPWAARWVLRANRLGGNGIADGPAIHGVIPARVGI